MPRPVFNGPFAMMDFPPYEFREYPKEISLKDGTRVVAQDQRHELELMTDDSTEAKPHPAEAEVAALAASNAAKEAELQAMRDRLAQLEAMMAAQAKPGAAAKAQASGPVPTP